MSKAASKRAAKKGSSSRWLWVGLGLAAIIMIGVFAVTRLINSDGTKIAAEMPAEIPVSGVVTLLDEGAFILDVRQPDEWAAFRIPDSTLIPLGELSARLNEVPRDRDIVVVCRSGNRSAQGRDLLLQNGFDRVTSMAGGLVEWQAQGQRTISGS